MLLGWSLMWMASLTLRVYQCGSRSINLTFVEDQQYSGRNVAIHIKVTKLWDKRLTEAINGSFGCLVTKCDLHSPYVWGPGPEYKNSNSRSCLFRSSCALPATIVYYPAKSLNPQQFQNWNSGAFLTTVEIGKKFKILLRVWPINPHSHGPSYALKELNSCQILSTLVVVWPRLKCIGKKIAFRDGVRWRGD